MPYKDKDKQRQANRAAKQRQRQGMTSQGMTSTSPVIPSQAVTLHPAIIRTINRLTTNPDGTVDEQARTNRLAMAINYERMFPGRPYTGTGL